MYLGTMKLRGSFLHTHKGSYALTPETNVFAPLPFLIPGILIGSFIAGFCLTFGDLMFPIELAVLIGLAVILVAIGCTAARLEIVNRELRNLEVATVTWGTRRHLNQIRMNLEDVIDTFKKDARK